MKEDTIAAISTGIIASGVAVIRLSGENSIKTASQIFKPKGKVKVEDFEPYKMYPGEIVADSFCDFGLCVYFKAPKSFTGEDVVEIHSHGGIAIAKGVLKSCLSHGARLAENGEFTKRAFFNGKISLSSAEGLIDMINSETESGVRAGYYLYRENLKKQVDKMQDELKDALSELDADMDFPEEDLEIPAKERTMERVTGVYRNIEKLLSTFSHGRAVKNGVKVGIIGKPNTGKSSLLNAFLDYDKAIVSNIAGTTRDIVEGAIDINGVRFNFSDTAGIRESRNEIESLGVILSKKILDESDVLLLVIDGNNFNKDDEDIIRLVKDKNVIVVMNKSDTGCDYTDADVKISALKKQGIEELKELMFEKTIGRGFDLNGDFLCEERHFEALSRARNSLKEAIDGAKYLTNDLIEIDVSSAWRALGEISGKTASEDIIDNIFSKFCVGK